MSHDPQQMRDLVGRYVEAFNQQETDMLDAILAPDFVNHNPLLDGLSTGREGEKMFARQVLDAFPDLCGNIEEQIIEGDMVVSRITWTCTQRGRSPGSAPFSITPVHVMKVANGTIVEQWTGFDELGMLQQLGVQPATSPKDWQKALA